MGNELIPLGREDRFQFACGPEVPCFNACCCDLNQFLTPYDILRLKTGLTLSAEDFLTRFTELHLGPQTGLPVVSLRTVSEVDRRCPFVSATGCRVYEDRPSSCRMYPLARAITRSRETGAVSEHFALMQEAHCRGCEQFQAQTVQSWIENQALEPYLEFNDMLMAIIALKNRHHPAPLDFREQRVFHLALYDLDEFRRHLNTNGFPSALAISEARRNEMMKNDVQLLLFGHVWLQWALFGMVPPA